MVHTPLSYPTLYLSLCRFSHIKSFGDLRKQFPGASGGGSAKAAAPADDDDVDLFGSDDEEVIY